MRLRPADLVRLRGRVASSRGLERRLGLEYLLTRMVERRGSAAGWRLSSSLSLSSSSSSSSSVPASSPPSSSSSSSFELDRPLGTLLPLSSSSASEPLSGGWLPLELVSSSLLELLPPPPSLPPLLAGVLMPSDVSRSDSRSPSSSLSSRSRSVSRIALAPDLRLISWSVSLGGCDLFVALIFFGKFALVCRRCLSYGSGLVALLALPVAA